MPKVVAEPIRKKTLLLNPKRLRELVRIMNATSESEAVREAISDAVAARRMLEAAIRIRRRGRF